MDLTFTKSGSAYVATFDAATGFNLHLEGGSNLSVSQRTSPSGQYVPIKGMSDYAFDKVIDLDFTGGLFPKSIKVISATEPTMAVVTFAE